MKEAIERGRLNGERPHATWQPGRLMKCNIHRSSAAVYDPIVFTECRTWSSSTCQDPAVTGCPHNGEESVVNLLLPFTSKESWQLIPQGWCLFDSSTLPPTAPLITVFMYFGSARQSKMAKLTTEAVAGGKMAQIHPPRIE
ncbi:unnamed protein product [Pleuronectes platessa]|uniref:Uncharacterized protein n=1 Tax=Pleuronectes platessa TaxID=8262 RepID=A0A9N7YU49_PLEPL|nr:unnamed protein product [Pleuronectes platessa]